MKIEVKTINSVNASAWDAFVYSHRLSNLYHLSGWRNVIKKTYGHNIFYLIAIVNDVDELPVYSNNQIISKSSKNFKNQSPDSDVTSKNHKRHRQRVVGILPLVHLKHVIFGNSLISLPFLDFSGILAVDEETEKVLIQEAIMIGNKLGSDIIEFRSVYPPAWINNSSNLPGEMTGRFDRESKNQSSKINCELLTTNGVFQSSFHKVRMILELSESSEILMKSFKSKLRSQIRKPLKEGLNAKIGGIELLDDFYKVFSINMRDLGSPVHSKKIIHNVLNEFTHDSKIIIVYEDAGPVAGSVVVGYKDILENPWASSLRAYSKLSPNMLLYWKMLEYACDCGFKYFDFGRSSPNEGTYKFKKQWGAKSIPLYWYYISLDGKPIETLPSIRSRFEFAAQVWKRLPVSLTKIIGPRIRKYISL